MTSNFVCNDCRGTVCEEAHILPMLNIQGKRSCIKCRIRIEKALENYICIPKGATLQANVSEGWIDIFTPSNGIEYRIKPSDPIYVYQWVCTTNGFDMRTAHISDEEFEKSSLQYDYWYKDINTKMERK